MVTNGGSLNAPDSGHRVLTGNVRQSDAPGVGKIRIETYSLPRSCKHLVNYPRQTSFKVEMDDNISSKKDSRMLFI